MKMTPAEYDTKFGSCKRDQLTISVDHNHDKNHQNQAYEIFNPEGPLAILPAPSNNKRKSTFIYSSKKPSLSTFLSG